MLTGHDHPFPGFQSRPHLHPLAAEGAQGDPPAFGPPIFHHIHEASLLVPQHRLAWNELGPAAHGGADAHHREHARPQLPPAGMGDVDDDLEGAAFGVDGGIDPGHPAGKGFAAQGFGGDGDPLTPLDQEPLGLGQAQFGFQAVEVGQGQQAGVGGDIVTGLDIPFGHHGAYRGDDAGLGHLQGGQFHLCLGGLIGEPGVGEGALVDQLAGIEGLHPLPFPPGAFQLYPRFGFLQLGLGEAITGVVLFFLGGQFLPVGQVQAPGLGLLAAAVVDLFFQGDLPGVEIVERVPVFLAVFQGLGADGALPLPFRRVPGHGHPGLGQDQPGFPVVELNHQPPGPHLVPLLHPNRADDARDGRKHGGHPPGDQGGVLTDLVLHPSPGNSGDAHGNGAFGGLGGLFRLGSGRGFWPGLPGGGGVGGEEAPQGFPPLPQQIVTRPSQGGEEHQAEHHRQDTGKNIPDRSV